MTNYELLSFLASDGGSYTSKEHREVLSAAFPDICIDVNRTRTLRAAMVNSCFVKSECASVGRSEKSIKVISVDKSFGDYARAKPKGAHQKITDSYFTCGHQIEIRAIQAHQQFDRLLRECSGNRQK